MGVFQVEGQGMRRVLMDLRPTEFDHITATISLYRPGPMEFIPDFIACLHGEKKPSTSTRCWSRSWQRRWGSASTRSRSFRS